VRDYIPKRTPDNIEFFKLIDNNPMEAFRGKITKEQYNKINKIILSKELAKIIIYYKKLYNRARPSQIAPELVKPLHSKTAKTPGIQLDTQCKHLLQHEYYQNGSQIGEKNGKKLRNDVQIYVLLLDYIIQVI